MIHAANKLQREADDHGPAAKSSRWRRDEGVLEPKAKLRGPVRRAARGAAAPGDGEFGRPQPGTRRDDVRRNVHHGQSAGIDQQRPDPAPHGRPTSSHLSVDVESDLRCRPGPRRTLEVVRGEVLQPGLHPGRPERQPSLGRSLEHRRLNRLRLNAREVDRRPEGQGRRRFDLLRRRERNRPGAGKLQRQCAQECLPGR